MRVTRVNAVQVHPVPDKVLRPSGPFPRELFRESEIIDAYDATEYGDDTPLGGTAQNNYTPPRALRCSNCFARVMENETENHVCEE